LPAVATLLGPAPERALDAAVAERGGRVESARPRFVNYRPGRRIAVRYRAEVSWPGGRTSTRTLVARASAAQPEPVAWLWPDDPRLPGARPATDADFVRSLIEPDEVPPGPLELSYRSYWPGRRAVLQATDRRRGDRVLFVKVVRPGEVARLHGLHTGLRADLPVARCLGWSEELGILVLEALPGRTISSCLADAAATPPPPGELLGILHQLGERSDLADGTPRRTTGAKIASHARLLRHLLPDEADALARFVTLYGDERPQPVATVHGDFHEEQVLTRDGHVSGLLDVDDVGPGQLVDDLALLVGRVRARARFGKRGRERAHAYERELLAAFGAVVDPHELRRRAAGALLGRATAPFRVQSPGWRETARERIRVAQRELERTV
jgi:aminoglycoside phosphotransferase